MLKILTEKPLISNVEGKAWIYTNPTAREITQLKNDDNEDIRFIITDNGDIIVGSAYHYVHEELWKAYIAEYPNQKDTDYHEFVWEKSNNTIFLGQLSGLNAYFLALKGKEVPAVNILKMAKDVLLNIRLADSETMVSMPDTHSKLIRL